MSSRRNKREWWQEFLRDNRGQDIIEYGMLAALVSVALVLLLMEFSDPLNAVYEKVLAGIRLASS